MMHLESRRVLSASSSTRQASLKKERKKERKNNRFVSLVLCLPGVIQVQVHTGTIVSLIVIKVFLLISLIQHLQILDIKGDNEVYKKYQQAKRNFFTK
ncbi:hypothetical protein [Cytobacillus praedii]|uniref:hypothetical protein n=1 Tax=Cytobacillus praedii TaxID=1742358 RepID=UPI002E22CF69|nr:hypothetical protein [Cytobacillus praedii]